MVQEGGLVQPYTQSFIHRCIHSFINPSIHSSIHPSIYSSIHPSIHPPIPPFLPHHLAHVPRLELLPGDQSDSLEVIVERDRFILELPFEVVDVVFLLKVQLVELALAALELLELRGGLDQDLGRKRRKKRGQARGKERRWNRLQYITLHCIGFNSITLHYIGLRCIKFNFVTLDWIGLDWIGLHCITLHCIGLDSIRSHHITLHYIGLRCIGFNSVTLHRIAFDPLSFFLSLFLSPSLRSLPHLVPLLFFLCGLFLRFLLPLFFCLAQCGLGAQRHVVHTVHDIGGGRRSRRRAGVRAVKAGIRGVGWIGGRRRHRWQV